MNPGDRRAAIHNINMVRDTVRDEINILGQANPQALQSWQNGVQAWSVIHRSNALTNWVEGVAKGPYAKLMAGPALGLFGVGTLGAIKQPLIAGPLSAVTAAGYKSAQTVYRVMNDQNLARYYWQAIGDVERQNLPSFLNNYDKLNKELEKSDSTKKKTKYKEK